MPTLIELDVDGHRAGVAFDDGTALIAIAAALGPNFAGVMTHAGGSYALSHPRELAHFADQEAARAAQEKASAEERAAAAKMPKDEAKPAAETTAKEADAKPITPGELLADVEGVSADDMRKFRAAAFKAQRDPRLKEIKAKQTQLRKEAEFLSAEEKKNLRGEFEQLQSDLRKANLAAIAQAAPDLAKESLEKIYEAVETRTREAIEKAGKKKAPKTPLKPFPFGEKK